MLVGVFSTDVMPKMIPTTLSAIGTSVVNFYLVLLLFGGLTTITEWKKIKTTSAKKIFYTFTFPLFIFTYVPIALVALFKKIEWKPINHTIVKSVDEVQVDSGAVVSRNLHG